MDNGAKDGNTISESANLLCGLVLFSRWAQLDTRECVITGAKGKSFGVKEIKDVMTHRFLNGLHK